MNKHRNGRLLNDSILSGLLFLAILAVCSGCGDGGVQKRLDRTIRDLQKNSRDKEILDVLQQATVETLETPVIAWVRVYTTRSSGARLWVYWIEKYPTPNAILIRNDKTGYQKIFAFNEMYLEENRNQARNGVIFRFVWPMEFQSEEWKELEPQWSEGELEAVLLRDGKPVSNGSKVELKIPPQPSGNQ